MRIEHEPGFVLHARAYRESSLIVDIFSEHHGRVSVVAKGARRNSKSRVSLQPFIPMLVSWMGKSSLKTLTAYEHSAQGPWLTGRRLYSAMYVNELLVYVLKEGEPLDTLYDGYRQLISQLAHDPIEPLLRRFEFALLNELGLGIDLLYDADQGALVCDNKTYSYVVNMGFIETSRLNTPVMSISGETLKCIASNQWDRPTVLPAAKQITRAALAPLLDNKVMNSRNLFL